MAMPRTTAESLFARCDTSGGPDACWKWQGRVSRRYGAVSMGSRPVRAHRAAWLLTHGDIPAGQLVCHACDEPLCCNPRHLWLGSHEENMRDCRAKGRQARGERHAPAKLTASQAAQIYELMKGETPRREIAHRFGVTVHALYRISGGYAWRHVTGASAPCGLAR